MEGVIYQTKKKKEGVESMIVLSAVHSGFVRKKKRYSRTWLHSKLIDLKSHKFDCQKRRGKRYRKWITEWKKEEK